MPDIDIDNMTGPAQLAEWVQSNLATIGDMKWDGPGDREYVLHPQSMTVSTLDHSMRMPRPQRILTERKLATPGDLVDYLRRFDLTETAIYVSLDHGIVAMIDDHTANGPSWTGHKATVVIAAHPTWVRMRSMNTKAQTQNDFAELVEDLGPNWVTPDGATMLEVAQTIEFAGERVYKSATRLSDGSVNLAFVDNTAAKAGASGTLTVPQRFELQVRPFDGIDVTARVTGRLRTRLEPGGGGGARFVLILDQTPQQIEREALDRLKVQLSDVLADKGVPVHLGTA
jgi:uncharacterized protein YfdQ (DUF2303 family)